MFYKVFQPHPALREFVNNIMVFQLDIPLHEKPPTISFPPLAEQCLYFYPFEVPESEYLTSHKKVILPQSILVGPQVNRIKLKMPHRNFTIKVGFQPGGLYRLLGIPMNEMIMDESLESTYFLDKNIKFIIEQLQETDSLEKSLEIVQNFLLSKLKVLKPKLPLDDVLPLISKNGGLVNIDTVASQACVSTRQLERLFLQRLGLQPKFFARMTRFAKAWTLKEKFPDTKWTTIAYQCGYFDQMHLIRDFKAFCGISPSVIEDEFKYSPYYLGSQFYDD
ncbi:helix-turn-helix domain-containing protein [Arcicella rigui]|uniref:Helix-turn-helix domain-containing protein n=1 Tax=Arcicella rigui TaxID=797020 RepID=A0ABU5Q8N9_9BACT|nr:helix-turn-helix domain-containing protein [Arcicella rigui]MEA5138937.1 helix-turn-helix domain-containing protein [Arcicella rigui]